MYRNILLNSIGKLLTIISMIISLKLAVLYLGISDAGYWENQLTIISIVYLFQSSAGYFFTYQFNKDKNSITTQNWIAKSITIVSFQGIVILVVLYFLTPRFVTLSYIKESEVYMFWVLIFYYTTTSFTEVYISLLNASGLAGKVAFYQGITNFISLILIMLLILKLSDVVIFVLAFVVQRILYSFFIVREIRNLGFFRRVPMKFLSKTDWLYFLGSYKFLFVSIIVILFREQLLKILIGSVNDKSLIFNYSIIIKIQTVLFVIPSFLSNPVGVGLADKFLKGEFNEALVLFKKAQFVLSVILSLAILFILWNLKTIFIFLLGKSNTWIESMALIYLVSTVFIIYFTSTISIFSKYIGWMKTEFEYVIINLIGTCLLYMLLNSQSISLDQLTAMIPIIWLFSSFFFVWRFKIKSGFSWSTFLSSSYLLFICTVLPVIWNCLDLNFSAFHTFIFSLLTTLLIIFSHFNQLKVYWLGLKSNL